MSSEKLQWGWNKCNNSVIGLLTLIAFNIYTQDINPYTGSTNITFNDYMEKFKPSFVWREIENKNRRNGVNKTFREEFEKVINLTDETDEILNVKIQNGDPKLLQLKDGRRWKPPPNIVWNRYDRYSIRRRLLELMKQAIYQARNKMVIMQILRAKYNKVSVYKMGFLTSKTDIACKTFARFAYKALKACTLARQKAITTSYPLIDMLEANERLLDLWFDVDLLVDLIVLNHENCKRMLNQVLTNRKHAWKFVD